MENTIAVLYKLELGYYRCLPATIRLNSGLANFTYVRQMQQARKILKYPSERHDVEESSKRLCVSHL